MRDVIRPGFHTKYTGMGAVVIEKKNGNVCVVPYRQPGIITGRRIPPPVPLLPCITPIERGAFKRIDPALAGNAITRDGKLNKRAEIPRMAAGRIHAILSAVLNDGYGLLPDIYSLPQIKKILAGIESSFHGIKYGYLVPISDCGLLPPV
ncbi:MAG: hypothetical protein WCY10_06955, partial [Candidatus Omnitrophota bacterium]